MTILMPIPILNSDNFLSCKLQFFSLTNNTAKIVFLSKIKSHSFPIININIFTIILCWKGSIKIRKYESTIHTIGRYRKVIIRTVILYNSGMYYVHDWKTK